VERRVRPGVGREAQNDHRVVAADDAMDGRHEGLALS
jgi:hypothetical protein